MLILTRRRGQAVDLIDKTRGVVVATVTILEILEEAIEGAANDKGPTIRLGVEAPTYIRIVRDNAVRRNDGEEVLEDVNGNG
jgi:sRNA-binding carbon storage regulator CsrA